MVSSDDEGLTSRGGLRWYWQLAVGVGLALAAYEAWIASGIGLLPPWKRLIWWSAFHARTAWIPWIPVSALVVWRWGWAMIHWTRAIIYRLFVYPRLRRGAAEAVRRRGPVTELAVLAVTYKEKAAITDVVFRSVFEECARVEGLLRPAVVVAVTGSDEDDAGIRAVYDRMPPERRPELVMMRGTDGKRRALAEGLEWIRRWQQSPDGAYVMMDGDTHLEPGAISRALPYFRLEMEIAALTTDEHVLVDGPGWFSEWLHLRHGLRDLYNSSISLGRRLLCLTGRYSVFRATALDDGFIEIVRNDQVDNWLWGRYQLLSGDDKSTWYHLLSKGARMLYVPDVKVVTHEVIRGSSIIRAYHNLRRWGGNMVRNSERAIRLGPKRTGFFCWWCLCDQRISMWTLLIGPTAFVMSAVSGHWAMAWAYVLWLIVSRTARSAASWRHGRRISPVYMPISALLDWAGALVKIYVVFFPAKQFWQNRGNRALDSTAGGRLLRDRRLAAGTMMLASLLSIIGLVAWLTGTIQVGREVGVILSVLAGAIIAVVGATLILAVLVSGRIQQRESTDG